MCMILKNTATVGQDCPGAGEDLQANLVVLVERACRSCGHIGHKDRILERRGVFSTVSKDCVDKFYPPCVRIYQKPRNDRVFCCG